MKKLSYKPSHELDSFLPDYDYSTQHSKIINASPENIILTAKELTYSDLRFAGLLFKLRVLPSKLFNHSPTPNLEDSESFWASMQKTGFIELDVSDKFSSVLGFIGQPWKLNSVKTIQRDIDHEEFIKFTEPGYIKGIMSISAKLHKEGTLLTTETRVIATCPYAAKKFRPYWFIIKPFSGLIRMDMLSSTARKAESY